MKIDCLGDMCPIPMIKLKEAIDDQKATNVTLVTDHSCATRTIEEYCKSKKYQCETNEVLQGVWEISIKKQHNI